MRTSNGQADPEDIFADTRMSFGDHIEVLRTHMIRAILGFIVGLLISFLFGQWVFHLITAPVEAQLMEFYNRRVEKVAQQLREGDKAAESANQPTDLPYRIRAGDLKDAFRKLGMPPPAQAGVDDDEMIDFPLRANPLDIQLKMASAARLVGRPPTLSTMNVMEAFSVYIKICAVTGLVISSPWVFWQMWSFIAAGLYPHEKRYVHYYLPVSLLLFLAGVLMCEFFVIPKAINALLWFNEWLGLEPDLRLNEWLSFALILPVVFGISFQTPLVMLFLAKVGILDADSFRRKRRIAWFVMAIFAAVITPIDALSMMMLWVPMIALYELGILMVVWSAKRAEDDIEAPSPEEELVEV
jgi:sec-independent protein translocase protein TatC